MNICRRGPNGWDCFTKTAIIRLLKKYQQQYHVTIPYRTSWPKEKLVNQLQQVLLARFRDNYQKPSGPLNGQWLSSIDILNVMKQYQQIFPNFRFIGPLPIDFSQLPRELSMVNVCARADVFGCVFNLDPHDQPGSHWVAMVVDVRLGLPGRPFIGYFDSLGVCPPPPEINRYLASLQKSLAKCYDIPVPIKYNSRRHQYQNSECGVYCLYFIYQCLLGRQSFEELTAQAIPDRQMRQWRSVFFR